MTSPSMASDREIERVAAYLRKSPLLKVQECVMAEKRVDVFKGSAATRALLAPAYARLKGVPLINNGEEAAALLQELLNAGMFLRARPAGGGGKFLQPDLSRSWSDEALYAWIYEGSQLGLVLSSGVLLVVVLACMLFPLWPTGIRYKASYLLNFAMYAALGIIAFLIALSIVRLIVYLFTRLFMKIGLWIFPNLWADCGVIESFQPFWEWELIPSGTAPPTTAVAPDKKEN